MVTPDDLKLDEQGGGPDFQKAVAAEVARQVATLVPVLLAQLAEKRGGEPAQPSAADTGWAEALAVAIAQLSDQGTGRGRRIAPEVLKARSEARERMVAVIIDVRSKREKPLYGLKSKVYLSEILIDPVYIDRATKEQKQQEIEWMGVPNEAMIPLNDAARRIYKEFAESIGTLMVEDANALADRKGHSVTAGGLVIRGGSLATRPVDVARDPLAALDDGNGLSIRGNAGGGIGNQREVRVLGTVAAPARVGH